MRNKDATHIQGLQTVPAEGMLAVLAHHLCTALVPLNVNFTFRTALDWCIILFVFIKRAEEKRRKLSVQFNIHTMWHNRILCSSKSDSSK